MDREYYLALAQSGQRMPIGTDLVLREKSDHDMILLDGRRLGSVVAEAAHAYGTPLAIPVMDLTIEKAQLLATLGVPQTERDTYHFASCPTEEHIGAVTRGLTGALIPRLQANVDAVRFIANNTDLVPCAMSIGPFSLLTKLLADPIAPVYLAGKGATGADDDDVRTVEVALDLCVQVILCSLAAQISAGARLAVIAEPAANLVYLSPKQIASGSAVFERLVMDHNRRIKAELDERGVDLFFHCCGELTDAMVTGYASLDPAILSLGCSRQLWHDAGLVSKRTVLYGNLPTKRFYADDLTVAEVKDMARETVERMREVRHPHILGSECDVLSVSGKHDEIKAKVRAFLDVPIP